MVGIVADCSDLEVQAATLARELELPLVANCSDSHFSYLLVLTSQRLELRQQGPASPGPVYADFTAGPLVYRRDFGGGRKQPLARAVGLKRGAAPKILDVTAGLGRDAYVLACLGCQVQLVERSPIVAALLRDGLQRLALDPDKGLVNERLHLSVADGCAFMMGLEEAQRPDVVYLDPMYPERTKTALVKKEMRALRGIVGEDLDAPALLTTALECARRRVVVKRPRLAPRLQGPAPSMGIQSGNTRFDMYVII